MSPDVVISVRELDERVNAGIQVRLLWSPVDGRAWVAVLDLQSGERFRVEVGADESARDVFHHPFAYRAARSSVGVGGGGSERAAELAG